MESTRTEKENVSIHDSGIKGVVSAMRYRKGTFDLALPWINKAKFLENLKRTTPSDTLRSYFASRIAICQKRADEILAAGFIGKTALGNNIVVLGSNTGKNLIIQRLASQNTYSLNITYGEIGTGSTAVAASDTVLTTPSVRVATTLSTVGTGLNIVSLQFFFPDSGLANATYYEFGTFVDGSATIGTGQMFNHILFSTPYTKNASEDTTIQVDFTVS